MKRANESDIGRRNGGAVLSMQGSERGLLTMLAARLREIDPDVYVGHNFAGFDLDVLLHRMQALKVRRGRGGLGGAGTGGGGGRPVLAGQRAGWLAGAGERAISVLECLLFGTRVSKSAF